MHVVILNQPFYPDVAATAQLMWDLAQHLDSQGHRVSAICSRYVYGTDQAHPLSYERIGNVEIHRVRGTSFGKKHLPGRACDFFTFYAAAFVKLQRIPRPDVILALTTPPMVALLGVIQRRFTGWLGGRRVRLVHHIMDLYPDAAVAMGYLRGGSLADRVMTRLTRRTLRASDAIIVLGRDMLRRTLDRFGLAQIEQHFHIVPPWSDGAQLSPLERRDNPLAAELGVADTFNIVYSGNLGMAHDVETIAAAIELMKGDSGTRFLFIGGGKRFDELKERAAGAGWTQVRFLPYQDRERLNHSLNLADVHLVSQLPEFSGIVVPSKLYGNMAVGRPAVMIGPPDVECSLVIKETDCGYVIPNGDAAGLAARLRDLRSDVVLRRTMGQRAREAFVRLYDRPIACRHIARLLESVVKNG